MSAGQWWHEPWPPADAALGQGDVEYDDSILVDEDLRRRAAEPPAATPSERFAQWKLRQMAHERSYLQDRGIHRVRVVVEGGWRLCTCGLLLPQDAREVDVRGHRVLPGVDRLDWVIITLSYEHPVEREVDRPCDVTCQRCGWTEPGLAWGDARDARVEHEQQCTPPVGWPRAAPPRGCRGEEAAVT